MRRGLGPSRGQWHYRNPVSRLRRSRMWQRPVERTSPHCRRYSAEPKYFLLACFALIVDANNECAQAFYERYSFCAFARACSTRSSLSKPWRRSGVRSLAGSQEPTRFAAIPAALDQAPAAVAGRARYRSGGYRDGVSKAQGMLFELNRCCRADSSRAPHSSTLRTSCGGCRE